MGSERDAGGTTTSLKRIEVAFLVMFLLICCESSAPYNVYMSIYVYMYICRRVYVDIE